MIRLLELRSAWGAGGGPEKTILLSAARHDRARVRPKVVYLKDPEDEAFARGIRVRAREAGVRILELPDAGRFSLRALAELRRLARKCDVIHAHDYKTDVYGLLLGRGGGRARLVATAHGWTRDTFSVRLYEKVDLLALRRYDRVIAVSEATRDVLLRGGVAPERVVLVRNAIDEGQWSPDNGAGDLRDELGLGPGALVVGTVTRLSREKGVDLFVEMAARVDAHLCARLGSSLARRPTFVVLGDGPEKNAIFEHARRAGIASRIRFLGDRRDVLRALNTFSVFVLPSRLENAPNALLEAMACAKPCVAFDVGGMSETLGEAGILVPGYETQRMADGVISLLQDDALRAGLGRLARDRVEREFSFARRLRRIESLYEEVRAEPPVLAPSSVAA
jgi:glycosyltransferase involved in cell wall biosynthesis